MDRNEVMEIAREAGAVSFSPPPLRAVKGVSFTFEQLERAFEIVASREREACAKVCAGILNNWRLSDAHIGAHECVKAIRARGPQK